MKTPPTFVALDSRLRQEELDTAAVQLLGIGSKYRSVGSLCQLSRFPTEVAFLLDSATAEEASLMQVSGFGMICLEL